MIDPGTSRILVVGAGDGAEALTTALSGEDRPTELVADPWAPPAGLVTEAALVVEAGSDTDAEAKAGALRALLDGLPGRVPVAVATRLHLVEALLPASRHGSRVMGLHLVGPPGSVRPTVAEVAMPARFDDDVVDAVLTLLEARGLVALPCGDAPGRIVDRLVAVAWLEARAATTAGAPAAVVATALADAGLSLAVLGPAGGAGPAGDADAGLSLAVLGPDGDAGLGGESGPGGDAIAVVAALHAGLGEPARLDPSIVRPRPPAPPDRAALGVRLALAVIAEAYRLVEEAVAGAEEIERAMTVGAGWAVGPFTLAGRRGLRAVVTALAAIARDPAEDAAARDRFAMPRVLWTMATV